MMKRYTLLVIFFVSLLLITPNVGFGATSAEIQSQIQAIMTQIKVLQQQMVQLQSQQGGTTAWCHTFNTNLGIGSSGTEVDALQSALIKEGLYRPIETMGTSIRDSSFTENIAAAVTGFQEKYRNEILTPNGLKYGTGYAGKSTRAKLNQLYGCGGVTKPPVSAGYLEIEPSSASLAVGGSVSMQAMYQPPMPKCPEGFECLQAMPARFPVVAEWTSSNPSVTSVDIIGSCAAIGCPTPTNVLIKGVSSGTADINALYNSPYGTDKVMSATARVTVGLVGADRKMAFSVEDSKLYAGAKRFFWYVDTTNNKPAFINFDVECAKGVTITDASAGGSSFACDNLVRGVNVTGEYHLRFVNVSGAQVTMRAYLSIANESNGARTVSFEIPAAFSNMTVLSPNGGESYRAGSSLPIKWIGQNKLVSVEEIYLVETRQPCGTGMGDACTRKWGLARGTENDGYYEAVIPLTVLEGRSSGYLYNYSVNILLRDGTGDQSDSPFSIAAATAVIPTLNVSLDVSTPTGVTLKPGQTSVKFAQIKASAGSSPVNNLNGIQIGSDSSNASAFLTNFKVFDGATQIGGSLSELYWGGGYYQNWIMLSGVSIPANTSKIFTVVADVKPTAPSGSVRLGIAGWNFNAPGAEVIPASTAIYGNSMTIVAAGTQPSITVTSPNGGEALMKGQSYFIRWAQTGFASDGWIQLQLRDAANSSAMVKLITSSVPLGTYAGSFNWTVPTDIPDGKYLLWATAGSGLDSLGTRVLGSDFSDAPFSIVSVDPFLTRDTKRIEDLTQIAKAIGSYFKDNGKYPGDYGTFYWINDNNYSGLLPCSTTPGGLKPYLPSVCSLNDPQGYPYAYAKRIDGTYKLGAKFEQPASQAKIFTYDAGKTPSQGGYYEYEFPVNLSSSVGSDAQTPTQQYVAALANMKAMLDQMQEILRGMAR